DGELSEIGGDPLAPEFFGDGGSGPGAGEEIGNKIATVAAGFHNTFEKRFRFLSRIADPLKRHRVDYRNLPDITNFLVGTIDVEVISFSITLPFVLSKVLIPLAQWLLANFLHRNALFVVCNLAGPPVPKKCVVKRIE